MREENFVKLITVRLLVEHFPTMLEFWRDVIKLPLTFSDNADNSSPLGGYAFFNAGETGVELMRRDVFTLAIGDGNPPTVAGRHAVVVFKVDDVDAAYAEFVDRGAKPIASPIDRPDWYARTAHVADPEGNIIEIYSSLQPAGGSASDSDVIIAV